VAIKLAIPDNNIKKLMLVNYVEMYYTGKKILHASSPRDEVGVREVKSRPVTRGG
jgi:hypothetical protein